MSIFSDRRPGFDHFRNQKSPSSSEKLNQNISLRQNPYNLGVVRNLVSFFQLRCCGLFKPSVVDWTQQTSLDQNLFGPSNMV
ncbi:hypothetical protein WMY93_033923 [Mugilogobius chulae]|uniref:Uncharacterized protein n=1 Tax=Mugilogobius chulae TaxID=88201 RepID=A0AAW0MIP2_9GOBI